MRTRAECIREIIARLDDLVDDLDGTEHECDSCGLHVKENWPEANAKNKLRESRKKFANMLREEWAKKGEDAEVAASKNQAMSRKKEN